MIRVLVVDDDFMVARVHGSFVDRTPGFETVAAAYSGREALDTIAAMRPDLVLLDIYLPDMTGLEMLHRLRASGGAGADVDVLVVTAANDVESVKQAMRGGVVGYLIKPFRYDELRARLDQVAQRRRRLGELSTAGVQQDEVDEIFAAGSPRPSAPPHLPKGVSAETVALVQKVLREAGAAGLSATECSEQTGLSRVSARRYLEHLAGAGSAAVSARYGGTGRPERRFRAR